MRKLDKKEHINLFFSAFLILAYTVCANFFSNFTNSVGFMAAQLISIGVYALFGLLLFYATRVGDGKAVMRFSPVTLLVMVLPAALIILISLAAFMPFHDAIAADKNTAQLSVITTLAAVSLGYGIPYTVFSGFELAEEAEDAEDHEDDDALLEGGVEEDLLDAEENAEAEEEEAVLQGSESTY